MQRLARQKFEYDKQAGPRIPSIITADELQEIISQSLWEWGLKQKLVSKHAKILPDSVLEACFRGMAMSGAAMDAGPLKSDTWLTESAKAWFMGQQAANEPTGHDPRTSSSGAGQAKLSKNQFTQGLKQVLGLHVPWANADALWRRILKDFPATEPPLAIDHYANTNPGPRPAGTRSPLSGRGLPPRSSYPAPSLTGRHSPPTPTLPPRGSPVGSPLSQQRPSSKQPNNAEIDEITAKELSREEVGGESLLFGADWRGQLRDLRRSRAANGLTTGQTFKATNPSKTARPKSAPLRSKGRSASAGVGGNKNPRVSGGTGGNAPKARVSAIGAAAEAADAADEAEMALLKAVAGSSHLTLYQFVEAFRPPQNHISKAKSLRPGSASAAHPNGGRSAGRQEGHRHHHQHEGPAPLNLHARGGSTDWMNEAFAKVMQAFDNDKLLLHEAFFVFDINGDGVVSLGEFVRVLQKSNPPLHLDKNSLFSLYTAIDLSGRRAVHMTEFVSFFLKLYQQRLVSLEHAVASLTSNLDAITSDLEEHMQDNGIPLSSGLAGSIDDDGASISGGGGAAATMMMHEGQPNEGLMEQEFQMLEAEHYSTNKAKEQAEKVMQYTALVVAAACELLANEQRAKDDLKSTGLTHGGGGITQYAPSTGKGSIASDYFHRAEIIEIFCVSSLYHHDFRQNKDRQNAEAKKLLRQKGLVGSEMQLALDAEKSSADAAAVRHDRERRTRRINEMLCYRIYKRNQILPLKQQALGTSYNASSDSMNIAVTTGKYQLKMEIMGRMDEEKKAASASGVKSRASNNNKDTSIKGSRKTFAGIAAAGSNANEPPDPGRGILSDPSLDRIVVGRALSEAKHVRAHQNHSGGGGVSVPGPFANLIRRVGLGNDAVRREMVHLLPTTGEWEESDLMVNKSPIGTTKVALDSTAPFPGGGDATAGRGSPNLRSEDAQSEVASKQMRRRAGTESATDSAAADGYENDNDSKVLFFEDSNEIIKGPTQPQPISNEITGGYDGTLNSEKTDALTELFARVDEKGEGSVLRTVLKRFLCNKSDENLDMRENFCYAMGLPKQQSIESFSAMFRIFFDAIDTDDEGDVTLAEMIRFAGDIDFIATQYASSGHHGLPPVAYGLLVNFDVSRSKHLSHFEIIKAIKLYPEIRTQLHARAEHKTQMADDTHGELMLGRR